ncbi:hypothetical protein GGF31_003932 [Allomyces arbusculus]|nr:hypothetical protein GGF31_003932 [Allomyces arbusculus]
MSSSTDRNALPASDVATPDTTTEPPAPPSTTTATSAKPMFKKKTIARGTRKFRTRTDDSNDDDTSSAPDASGENGSDEPVTSILSDIKEARKVRAKPRGIDVETLLKPASADTSAASGGKGNTSDITKLHTITHGGLMDMSKEKDGYLTSFTGTNKTLDATKHMERFIEQEMAKKRGKATDEPQAEKPKAVSYEDELFEIPEHLRVAAPEVKEGNVTASAAMLTAIPEVDLGQQARVKALEKAEQFRSTMQQLHQSGGALPADFDEGDLTPDQARDLAFSHNPFPSMRWRISRRTRETLFDLHAAQDILHETARGGRRGSGGIVTNDETLRQQLEADARLAEGSSSAGPRGRGYASAAEVVASRFLRGGADVDRAGEVTPPDAKRPRLA